MVVLILTIIQGPDKGKTFELPDHEPQLLGRSSEALPLTDNTVSRRHAELTPDAGQWFIRDLGSQNGTWVNGTRIEGRTRLRQGDQVRTGATLVVFGSSDRRAPVGPVRVLRPDQMDTSIERSMVSNEDSVIMSEPEPRQAAIDHLRVIYGLTTLTTRTADRSELLEGVMDLVFSEFKPERGVVLLSDAGDAVPRDPEPTVVRYAGLEPGHVPPDEPINVSKSILQAALRNAEGVLSSNAMTDARFRSGDSVQSYNIRSAICSPIRFRDRTFGAIYIDSTVANYTFTPEQLALMNAIGQHTGLALANVELLQQKLRAERLAAMGETVASLSHSIKNILQGLRGGADVVEMGLKREDLKVARGGWPILKRNLDRIIGLTTNMLAYSRPRTLELELTKVGPLLEDCASLMQDMCQARDVALIVDAEADMPPIPMDAGQIHQCVMNLLTNAVDAVEAKTGVVTVRASFKALEVGKGEARIEVIDNGPGIPPAILEKVFLPFFTTKGLRGTGLGLAVTKRLIEQHHGRVEVKSQTGKGAVFTLVIPVDPQNRIDPAETAASRGDTRRKL